MDSPITSGDCGIHTNHTMTLEEALDNMNKQLEETIKKMEEINTDLKKILSFGEEHNISE